MLELRPTCENCNAALPPDSEAAMICSFECTFCVACVRDVLLNVCPTCGGGFVSRPVRPRRNWRGGNHCGEYPPTERVRHRPIDAAAHRTFAVAIADIVPSRR